MLRVGFNHPPLDLTSFCSRASTRRPHSLDQWSPVGHRQCDGNGVARGLRPGWGEAGLVQARRVVVKILTNPPHRVSEPDTLRDQRTLEASSAFFEHIRHDRLHCVPAVAFRASLAGSVASGGRFLRPVKHLADRFSEAGWLFRLDNPVTAIDYLSQVGDVCWHNRLGHGRWRRIPWQRPGPRWRSCCPTA